MYQYIYIYMVPTDSPLAVPYQLFPIGCFLLAITYWLIRKAWDL